MRGGKKHKDKRSTRESSGHRNLPDVIVIDDGDDSDSNSVNSQVEQLRISPRSGSSLSRPRSRLPMQTPSWGAGAKGNQGREERMSGPGTNTPDNPQAQPNMSDFLAFSDKSDQGDQGPSLKPRSESFAHQMSFQSQATPLTTKPTARGAIAPILPLHNPSQQMQQQFIHAQQQMMVSQNNLQQLMAAGRMNAMVQQGTPPIANPPNAGPSGMVQGRFATASNVGASSTVQDGASSSTHSQGMRWAANLYSTDAEFPKARVKGGHPPGTKIVKDNRQVSIRKYHTRGGRLHMNEVDASIQECVEALSKAGEHVSLERLEAMIKEKYQVTHFSQLNINYRNFMQMPTANEHSRLLCKVNSYAHSFVRARSMCTLFELGECMREFHKEGLEFERLELGPLQAMPVVYELFKFPVDEYIPEITSVDIIEHLNNFLTSANKWMDKVQLDDFLEYLVAMYQVESPFSLGVRLKSVPLAIQMLKKSKRDAGQSRRAMLDSFASVFVDDVNKAMNRFRESILQSGPDNNQPALRLHYSNLQPADALKEIYTKFEVLAALMGDEGSNALQVKMRKFQSSFASFRRYLDSDSLTRQLFHLAVCLSVTDVQESAVEFLEEQRQPKAVANGSEPTTGKTKRQTPPKGSVVEKIVHYINQCLQDGSLLLSHLKRIEEKVVEVFEFSTFDELGQGAFLYFLLSNTKTKELLDDCGGAMLGSASTADKARYYHSTFYDLKEFVCQAKQAGATQFSVKDVKTLGHGSITRLCQAASTPGKHDASQYNCHFEAALCGKACPSTQSTQSVGRLGNQSREKALAALTSCPLLDDLEEWSHWRLVFQPEHGDLKDFVAKYGGRRLITLSGAKQEAVSDFMALETAPGKLLKISSQSTPDLFSQALEDDDPLMAAGHLTSIMANSRGVESAPLALMANQVKNRLLSLRALQGASPSLSFNERDDPKVALIAAILMRIPVRICAAVANQVLLDPLSNVVGSAKSKMAVRHACSSMPWQRERLECLGILLGIPEWAQSLQDKMIFPSYLVRDVVVDELFGQAVSDEEEKEEEVVEDEGISDDEDDDICKISSEDEESTTRVLSEDGTNESSEGADEDDKSDGDEKDKAKVETSVDLTGEGDDQLGEERKAEEDGEEKGKVEEEMCDESKKEVKDEIIEPVTREEICHRVVDTIRREEFGEGIELSEEASKLLKTQQDRQGRSLTRLSRDLYSKDTHFVLELIQNADDNTYPNPSVPSLKFVIDASGVTIQNNELGFEERNVRALCDVGKSTKSKHVLGYIGQKGIGFKSVFRVTDRPEIHSNGFHICFDVKSGPMGYIMPHWIGDPPTRDESWQTQILLPWTDDIKNQIETHAARFNDIQPSLLLFLHRLREITITNKVEGCEMRMSRRDLPTGEVLITHSHGVDRWLVVRKVLDCTQVSVEAKSGVDVQSTEIALAFPLKDKTNTLSQGTRLGQLPVFAFLPLQSYGFRFIVQGDFNVPSSRESVDKDSCWNQWLRDRIPALFIQAWDSFLALPDITQMDAFIHYLQFIPLEGEVMGFFSPVTSRIRSQLMAKDCMPVIGTSGNKDDIVWKAPSKTVMAGNSLVREIISPRLLLQNLGLYYLHWDVLESVDHGTLRALGVHTIGTDHLLQIGQGISAHWDCKGSPDQVIELAKWLACVYCSLDSFKENTDIFNRLAKMRLIPLSDGSLVSMEDTTVFLLTGDSRHDASGTSQGKGKKSRWSHDPLQALRQDVNIIHPALTSTSDPEVNSQVTKLLSRMDIKEMTGHDLLHSHVLPVLHSDAWKEKSMEVLVGYLVCAKQVLFDCGEDLSPLKEVARVVTTQGVKQPSQDNVHFPVIFGNEIDLVKTFPSLSWTLLSPAYLSPNPTKAEQEAWHKFFFQLGVRNFLCVNKVDVPLDHNSLLSSPWAQYQDLWQSLPEQFVIEDFACEEFQLLIGGSDVPFDKMCRLYELLDKSWDETYRKWMITKVKAVSGEVLKDNIETSFSINLKQRPWVPATWATTTTDTKLEKDRGLLRPSRLYCANTDVERLLAHTAKYLAVKTPSKSSLTQFLQIKSTVQKEAVKEALISWGQRAEGKTDTPVVFSTSVNHIMAVYEFLQYEFPAGEIQNLFHKHPVIFIASRDRCAASNSSSGIMDGHMMYREEMWWTDECGLFSKYRESLEKYGDPMAKLQFMYPFYHGREDLFRIARIDHTHNMLHLANLLKHITSVLTLEDEGLLHDVLSLFSAIGLGLSKAYDTQAGVQTQEAQVSIELKSKVKAVLSDVCVFPTRGSKLVGLEDNPMIADSKEWEKMFEGKPRVHFLLLESPLSMPRRNITPGRPNRGGQSAPNAVDHELIQYFLEMFEDDIKQLSDCVVSEEITSGFKPCARGQKYLHDIVGVLQQFLYYCFPDVYTAFKTNNADQLKDLIFTEVDRLEVKYELKDRPEVFEIRPENCIIKDNHFYFQSKNIDNQPEINKEVARYFSSNNEECVREIRNFLSRAVPILEGKSTETLQDLLAMQCVPIGDLPKEEEVWEVPLPTVINPLFVPQAPPSMDQGPVIYERQDSDMQQPFSAGGGGPPGDQGDGAIRSWPPRSGIDYDPNIKQGGPRVPVVSKFAPPEAPDYIKASKKIPSNFRFENEPDPDKKRREAGEEERGERGAGGGGGGGGEGDVERRPSERVTDSKTEGTSRQVSAEDEDASGQSRGKRKLLSESASEEGESQTPAYKRQSLEANDDEQQNSTPGTASQGVVSVTERGDASKGRGGVTGGVYTRDSSQPRGQGLVAVPRQISVNDPEHGVVVGNEGKRMSRPAGRYNTLQFNIPMWAHQPDNLAFTDLTPDIPKFKPRPASEENPEKDEIGRWGESLVYDYLRKQMLSNDTVEDVIWANAAEEQGLPYDFEMIFKTTDSDEVYSVFIEVKATRTEDKAVFEISANQVEFAFNAGERFQIFRVFGAGEESMRLVRIDNIADRLRNKSVRLLMVI